MENLKFNHTLDWVTATFTSREFPETVLPMYDAFELKEATKGGAFYENAYKLACGGLYAHSSNVRQGIMVMLPGQALGSLRKSGWSDEMTINWLMTAHNVSRMDYAVDIFGGTAKDHSPHDAYNAWKEGRVKTKMRLDRSYIDHSKVSPGETYYFGSKHSNARVVVYNKGVQMDMFKYAWTRVEMRLKDEYAKNLRNDMNDNGVSRAGNAKLKSIWDADIEWFEAALQHDPMLLSSVPHKPGNFPGWLERVIKPAIEKNLARERDAIRIFYDWLGEKLYGVSAAETFTDQ